MVFGFFRVAWQKRLASDARRAGHERILSRGAEARYIPPANTLPHFTHSGTQRMTSFTYQSAGVDLGLYNQAMKKLPALMKRTHTPRVIDLADGCAGL